VVSWTRADYGWGSSLTWEIAENAAAIVVVVVVVAVAAVVVVVVVAVVVVDELVVVVYYEIHWLLWLARCAHLPAAVERLSSAPVPVSGNF